MNAIEASNVAKVFREVQALAGVTITVRTGEFYGLLGPNGAGKTTFLRIVSGFLDADSGSVNVAGASPRDAIARAQRGLVPQEIALYEELSAAQNLAIFGKMYGLSGAVLKARLHELLDWVGLAERAHSRVKTFSGGMKRRLNLAAGLLHDPELILLDEPTVGVDPQSRSKIFSLLQELQRRGKTIVYTTHYMEEAERLCQRIGIMDRGKLITEGTLSELLSKLHVRRAVRCHGLELEHAPHFADSTLQAGSGYVDYVPRDDTRIGETLANLERSGTRMERLEVVLPNLEGLFLELTGRELRD